MALYHTEPPHIRKKKVVAKPAAVVPKPPTKKIPRPAPPYPGYKSPAQLAQEAQDLALKSQATARAAYQKQHDDILASSQQSAQWHQQIYQALAAQLAGLGPQLQSQFNHAAKEQLGYASGYATGLKMDISADAAKGNADLKAIGAPEGQTIDAGGGGSTAAADTLYTLGGEIPAEMFRAQGKGAAQEASSYPMQALFTGENTARQINSQGWQQAQDPLSRLGDLNQALPDAQQGFYDDLVKQQQGYQDDYTGALKDRQDQALKLYSLGLISKRSLAQIMGVPGADSLPDTLVGSGSGATKLQRVQFKDGTYGSYDPTTGQYYDARHRAIDPGKYVAPTKPGAVHGSLTSGLYRTNADGSITILKAPKDPNLSPQTINGHVWLVNLRTGEKIHDLGKAGVGKAGAAGSHAPQAGGLLIWNPRLNGGKGAYQPKPGYAYGPGGVLISTKKATAKDKIIGPGGVPMTNAEINASAGEIAADLYAIKAGKDTLANTLERWKAHAIPQAIWGPLLVKAYGMPRDPAQLKNMNVDRLAKIAMVIAPNDFATAVKPRQGGFSKAELLTFINGHLPIPKGEAPAETGAALVGYARQQLGQPYVWGGESRSEGGFDCSGLVDFAARQMGYTGPRLTTYNLATMGVEVSKNQLKAGDLIITHGGEHVVMYAGNGQVIAAPHTGTNVQMQPLSKFKIEKVRRLTFADANPPKGVHAPAGTPNYRAPKQQVSLATKYGRQYGVDPRVLLAIAGHETQYGTQGAGRDGFTLGYGVTDSGTITKYRGAANQYRYAAKTLASWGVHTIQDILNKKAHAYASDPGWERGVASVFQNLV